MDEQTKKALDEFARRLDIIEETHRQGIFAK